MSKIKSLKTVEVNGTTYAVIQDGKPVYTYEDGTESAFDAPASLAAITARNGEAQGHRERAETAEKKLAKFEGIEDPDAAREALKVVGNLDQSKLIDAGKVDEIKNQHGESITKALTEKYEPYVKENQELKANLDNEIIGGAFARSKYIADNLIIPADMVRAQFGKHFVRDESGGLIAKDVNGNVIHGKENPAAPASFDEALATIVAGYSHKDNIIKGSGAGGGGSRAGAGGEGGDKVILRSEYDADPGAFAGKLAEGYNLVDD